MTRHEIHRLHSSDSNIIMEIIESGAFAEQNRTKRGQRLSRIALLWALLSFLMMLVVLANMNTAGQRSVVDWSIGNDPRIQHPFERHERRLSSRYKSEDWYRREILIRDYKEMQDYFQEGAHEGRRSESNSEMHRQDWSEDQIAEMERCYKRYLEVFVEAYGDQYEPESKEVVYAEYLRYLERTAKQNKQKADPKQTSQATTRTLREESKKSVGEEPPAETPPDESMRKYDPFDFEHDWKQFNEVGGDRLNQSNNSYTEMSRRRTSRTTAATVDTDALTNPKLSNPIETR